MLMVLYWVVVVCAAFAIKTSSLAPIEIWVACGILLILATIGWVVVDALTEMKP